MHMKSSETGFYDMHSHILPEIDDGASSYDAALRMADMAYDEGIRCMCATPHYDQNTNKESLIHIISAFQRLTKGIKDKHPDFTLFLGNEILYSYNAAEDLKLQKALTINSSRYALVEFIPGESYKNIYNAIRELIRSCYVPVIAHMERLECLWKQWDRLEELKHMYIVFQMNTSSLTGGRFDSQVRYCRKLVKDGYIDILGSDCHGDDWRPPVYDEAADWIRRDCGEDVLKQLAYHNPRTILKDEILH